MTRRMRLGVIPVGCGGLECLIWLTRDMQGSCRAGCRSDSGVADACGWPLERMMLCGEADVDEQEARTDESLATQPTPRTMAFEEHPPPARRTSLVGTQAALHASLTMPFQVASRGFAGYRNCAAAAF